MKRIAVALLAVVAVILAGCSSGPNYKTITCKQYEKLADDKGTQSGGVLDVASDLIDDSVIDPKGGADDTADLADTIESTCEGEDDDTKVADLKSDIVDTFLTQHPQDIPH